MNFNRSSIENQLQELEIEKDALKVIEAKDETLVKNKFGVKYKTKRKKYNKVAENNRKINRNK